MHNAPQFQAPKAHHVIIGEVEALPTSLDLVQGDVMQRAALEELFSSVKFDQVIHLAARAGVRPSLEDPALYQRVNVDGSVNLFEAARRHGVKQFMIASSSSVYGVNSKIAFSDSDAIFSAISPDASSR